MFKNNLFKLNLNSSQIIKFGSHIGNSINKLDYSNIPYLCGIKNKTSYIDVSESVLQIKRLAFLQKKLLSKKESIIVHNNSGDKIIKSINNSINNNNLFNVKVLKNFNSGLVSNKEIRSKFLILKKFNYNNLSTFSSHKRNFFKLIDNKKISPLKEKVDQSYYNSYPSLLVLLGHDKNVLSEFKNKNILTSCLVDTKDFHYVSDYNILLNNKSVTSLNYFSKIFKV